MLMPKSIKRRRVRRGMKRLLITVAMAAVLLVGCYEPQTKETTAQVINIDGNTVIFKAEDHEVKVKFSNDQGLKVGDTVPAWVHIKSGFISLADPNKF